MKNVYLQTREKINLESGTHLGKVQIEYPHRPIPQENYKYRDRFHLITFFLKGFITRIRYLIQMMK
jgi:hypothetical protein